jgi:hypothetical protein
LFDLIKRASEETKDAQYQGVSDGHWQSSVGPPTFCTLDALCCDQTHSHKVIRLSRRNKCLGKRESITKACAVKDSHKYRPSGLMRHRSRIAPALDKIILMIFDEHKVGGSSGTATLDVLVRLSGRPFAWIPTPEQLHKIATSRPKKPCPSTRYSRHAEITLAPPSPADAGAIH